MELGSRTYEVVGFKKKIGSVVGAGEAISRACSR